MDYSKIILLALTIFLSCRRFQGAPANQGVICVEQPRDLFLVVDDSASIGHRDIKKVRSFLSVLVSSVHVSRHMTRIGLLQFSDKENTGIRFNLDNKFGADKIRQKINNLNYKGGPKTLTDLALGMVADQVFTKNGGDRPGVPDILVVLTDGQSRFPKKTAEQASRLKAMGVRIIAIGAGHDLLKKRRRTRKLEEELLSIASSPEDMKMVDFANLENIVIDIVDRVCRIVTTPAPAQVKTPPRQSPPVRALAPTVEVQVVPTVQVATTLSPIGCAATDGKDILFVFDGTVNFRQSYDESQKDFKKIRNFIKAVVRDLDDERFRVGVMQYSGKDTATMEIDFMSPTDLAEIKIRLGTIVQQGGYERYIGEALVKANHQFYDIDAVKQRERNPNVIVLITRGLPKDRDHAISEARMLESRDVRLISIGLHSGTISKHLEFFLRDMSFPKYTFYHEYKTLKKNREAILDAMCVKASNVPSAGLPRDSAKCRRGPHDVFFVIDGSASIKYHNFEKVQIFLMDLITLLRVEPSQINTGLVQFSKEDQTSMVWDLGRYSEFELIMNIRNMKYQAGVRTATGDALTRVNNEVFTGQNGDRPGIPDIAMIFTDGNAHDFRIARKQAKILREKGVLVITIGAGTKESLRSFKQELVDMASSPEYALTVNFEQLEYFAEKAFPLFCQYFRRRRL